MSGTWYAHLDTVEENSDRLIGRWTDNKEVACKGSYPGLGVILKANIRSRADFICPSNRNIVVIETARRPTVLTT